MPTTDITTQVHLFDFNGYTVRVIIDENGLPWFIGKDVATALGYTNSRKAIADHVDTDDKNTVTIRDGIGNPNKTVINESGVYSLVMSSQLPAAKEFKRWVTAEVLPSIRQTGSYRTQPQAPVIASASELTATIIADPDFGIKLLTALKFEREQHEIAKAKVAELEPKAEALDVFTAVEGSYSVADAAKILSNDLNITIGRNRLYGFMAEINWVFRDSATRTWKAYQSQVDNGRLEMKAHTEHGTHHDGTTFPFPPTVRITAKGLAKLRRQLLSGGTVTAA